MGNAIISRGGGSISLAGDGNALVRVTTSEGATVTATSGTKVFTKNSSGLVELSLSYGTWTITSVTDDMTLSEELIIDTLKVYSVNLKSRSYGISIDMNQDNPSTAVTYTGLAEGFTPLSCNLTDGSCNYGDWETIITNVFGCKPCLYNGTRFKYLNPNDYTKFEDGTDASKYIDGTTGSYDVMVEFKRTWYKYSKEGNILTFEVSDYDRSDEGFVSSAFYSMDKTATIKDYMYYSAYEGFNVSNKIRSLSGKTPTANVTYTNFRTYCKATGTNYGMEDICKRSYILGLLMLVTKSRGIQAAIGNGRVNISSVATGTLNNYGLFAGFSDTTKAVKCFGIENMWGSLLNWCDGIVTKSSTTLGIKLCPPYNDTGNGYTEIANGLARDARLYATQMAPQLDGAITLPSVAQSNSTIGWPDCVCVASGSGDVAGVGGGWDYGVDAAGPFCLDVCYAPSDGGTRRGARLVGA